MIFGAYLEFILSLSSCDVTTYCLRGGASRNESGSKSGYLPIKNLCSRNRILYQTFDDPKRDASHVTM